MFNIYECTFFSIIVGNKHNSTHIHTRYSKPLKHKTENNLTCGIYDLKSEFFLSITSFKPFYYSHWYLFMGEMQNAGFMNNDTSTLYL